MVYYRNLLDELGLDEDEIIGAKMNQKTKDCGYDVVAIVEVDGEEYIQYKPIPAGT